MGQDAEIVRVALDLRETLRRLPSSAAADESRACCEDLIARLGRSGYHFPRTPEEAAGRSKRLAARQHEAEQNTARASGSRIRG